jgi:hypothetical protein
VAPTASDFDLIFAALEKRNVRYLVVALAEADDRG